MMTSPASSASSQSPWALHESKMLDIRTAVKERGDYTLANKILISFASDLPQPFLKEQPTICRRFISIMVRGLQSKQLIQDLTLKVMRNFIRYQSLQDYKKEDVVFQCEDGDVRVSKKFLALMSPYYFNTFYLSPQKEAAEQSLDKQREEYLDYKDYDVKVLTLLKNYFYTQQLPDLNETTATHVFQMYDLSKLVKEDGLRQHCIAAIKIKAEKKEIKTDEQAATFLNFLSEIDETEAKKKILIRCCLESLFANKKWSFIFDTQNALILGAEHCHVLYQTEGDYPIIREKIMQLIFGLILTPDNFQKFIMCSILETQHLQNITILIFNVDQDHQRLQNMLAQSNLEMVYQACPELKTVGIILPPLVTGNGGGMYQHIKPFLNCLPENPKQGVEFILQQGLNLEDSYTPMSLSDLVYVKHSIILAKQLYWGCMNIAQETKDKSLKGCFRRYEYSTSFSRLTQPLFKNWTTDDSK